ncbi:MAG: hypothetical protein IPP39_15040 [Chitinophagaceae bacterium]|nr:hypothetical protein [Chitinophagaceae bacterium]
MRAKLVTVADNDWEEFAKEVIINAANSIPTPQEYYNYYFYGNIIQRLIGES